MDLSDLVQKQKAWFQTGATQSLEARQTALKALYETVKNMEGDVARALEQDLGKAPCESYLCETGLVLHEIRYHLAHVKGPARRPGCISPPAAKFGPGPWGCPSSSARGTIPSTCVSCHLSGRCRRGAARWSSRRSTPRPRRRWWSRC